MTRERWMFVLVCLAVLAMGLVDTHPATAGKSPVLLTVAAYPKVYVHLVGGMALFALLLPLVEDYFYAEWLAVLQVTVLGFVYELLQWANLRGETFAGVFTFQEAVAVALGAVILALWYGAVQWQRGGGVSIHR